MGSSSKWPPPPPPPPPHEEVEEARIELVAASRRSYRSGARRLRVARPRMKREEKRRRSKTAPNGRAPLAPVVSCNRVRSNRKNEKPFPSERDIALEPTDADRKGGKEEEEGGEEKHGAADVCVCVTHLAMALPCVRRRVALCVGAGTRIADVDAASPFILSGLTRLPPGGEQRQLLGRAADDASSTSSRPANNAFREPKP